MKSRMFFICKSRAAPPVILIPSTTIFRHKRNEKSGGSACGPCETAQPTNGTKIATWKTPKEKIGSQADEVKKHSEAKDSFKYTEINCPQTMEETQDDKEVSNNDHAFPTGAFKGRIYDKPESLNTKTSQTLDKQENAAHARKGITPKGKARRKPGRRHASAKSSKKRTSHKTKRRQRKDDSGLPQAQTAADGDKVLKDSSTGKHKQRARTVPRQRPPSHKKRKKAESEVNATNRKVSRSTPRKRPKHKPSAGIPAVNKRAPAPTLHCVENSTTISER